MKITNQKVIVTNIMTNYQNNIGRYPLSIQLYEQDIPQGWQQELIANQKVGGVFLVFISANTKKELKEKGRKIKQFCKSIKSKNKKREGVE